MRPHQMLQRMDRQHHRHMAMHVLPREPTNTHDEQGHSQGQGLPPTRTPPNSHKDQRMKQPGDPAQRGRSTQAYKNWVKQVLEHCEPTCIRCGYPVDMSLPRSHPKGIGRGNPQHRAIKRRLSGMDPPSPSQMRTRVHPLRISRRHVPPTHRPTRRKRRPRTTISRNRRPHPRTRRIRNRTPRLQSKPRRKTWSTKKKKFCNHKGERPVFKAHTLHSRRPCLIPPKGVRGEQIQPHRATNT